MWLRKWRYRFSVHLSFFMEEATIFRKLHGPGVLEWARMNFRAAWVSQLQWKRCQEGAPENLDGHVIHHMGRWTSQIYVHEIVDVLNMKTPARVSDAQASVAKRQRKR